MGIKYTVRWSGVGGGGRTCVQKRWGGPRGPCHPHQCLLVREPEMQVFSMNLLFLRADVGTKDADQTKWEFTFFYISHLMQHGIPEKNNSDKFGQPKWQFKKVKAGENRFGTIGRISTGKHGSAESSKEPFLFKWPLRKRFFYRIWINSDVLKQHQIWVSPLLIRLAELLVNVSAWFWETGVPGENPHMLKDIMKALDRKNPAGSWTRTFSLRGKSPKH